MLGLILGKTDTPALRNLETARGVLGSEDDTPPDATLVAEAFDNLENGPTWFVGEQMRVAVQLLASLTRNQAVQLMAQASAAATGE